MAKKLTPIFIAIFLLGSFGYFYFSKIEKQKIAWRKLEANIKEECGNFDGEAGIIIKDLNSGLQLRINPDKLFPSASLVKVPIMAACFYAAKDREINLQERLKLKASHRVLGSGRLKEAPLGAEFSIDKLIGLMVSESDNTSANMLIERLGFAWINGCFKKLGLKYTNISRRMVDLKSRKEGKENFTTASDLARLFEEIYSGRLINKTYSEMCLDLLKKQKINDRIPVGLPSDTVIAHKTGLENSVCHDAGIVFKPGGDFLICVLTKHKNNSAKSAKKFIARIAFLTYNYRNL